MPAFCRQLNYLMIRYHYTFSVFFLVLNLESVHWVNQSRLLNSHQKLLNVYFLWNSFLPLGMCSDESVERSHMVFLSLRYQYDWGKKIWKSFTCKNIFLSWGERFHWANVSFEALNKVLAYNRRYPVKPNPIHIWHYVKINIWRY